MLRGDLGGDTRRGDVRGDVQGAGEGAGEGRAVAVTNGAIRVVVRPVVVVIGAGWNRLLTGTGDPGGESVGFLPPKGTRVL
mmetsp:Transcript_104990/g.165660  ORF Transcript_104990/g.165660 Transcript_104990/m.165660 type:complete len:81 (+) Transcript_104990:1091-1333(+)